MNKFAMTAATAALMLSLSAGALAASGLGSVTTMSGAGAEADKAGSVTINTTMCALELDDAGKITAVSFDIAQNKVGMVTTSSTVLPTHQSSSASACSNHSLPMPEAAFMP